MSSTSSITALARHFTEFGAAWALRSCAENLAAPLGANVVKRIHQRSVRRQGLRFDARHGTATARPADPSLPDDGHRYEPTDEASFHWFLRKIDILPGDYTFLDIGAGRGKVALLAARSGFGRVIGIEYDSELLREAEANVAALATQPAARTDRIQLQHADATKIDPPDGPLVVWCFNPFGRAGLDRMLDGFEHSWLQRPRELIFGYYNALHPEAFDREWLRCVIPETPLLIGNLAAYRSSAPAT